MLDRGIVAWAIDAMWIVWGVVWLAKAFGNKRNAFSQSWLSRFGYLLASIGLGLALAYGSRWRTRLFPETMATQIAGMVLCAAGIGVAIWSRFILGSNWSGIITLKENHELIRRGPYKYVRHPIYSGMILGILGTFVAVFPRVNGLLIVISVAIMLKIKSLQEEKILIASFPNDYRRYRKEVKSLIPLVM
ncbi:MAG: isoprenylcysteine carboxylmethyltransferase family protein [Tepidisphaeraceae bacterium]